MIGIAVYIIIEIPYFLRRTLNTVYIDDSEGHFQVEKIYGTLSILRVSKLLFQETWFEGNCGISLCLVSSGYRNLYFAELH